MLNGISIGDGMSIMGVVIVPVLKLFGLLNLLSIPNCGVRLMFMKLSLAGPSGAGRLLGNENEEG